MKSIRKVLAGSLVAGGALLAAAASFGVASAADDAIAGTTASAPSATPGHHGWGPERIYSKLNLTAEQKASIKAIYSAAKPQMQNLHATMKANHLKMTQTTPDDPNYASVVAEVAQSNAALASQRTTQNSEIKAQIYALLTPAQKTQLATLEAEWAANPHQGRWGHWGQRGPASAATTAPAT
jgi:Spy/CpxP family protein refolding chaperone